jgi:prepilin-type N-terminal cleavage/methylation domain-containing protein
LWRRCRLTLMKDRSHIHGHSGYSLVEVLVVLSLLGVCLAIGALVGSNGLRVQQARGAAQVWQTAAAWAQSAVLWHGASVATECGGREISVVHSASLCGSVGLSAPEGEVDGNVARWRRGGGQAVVYGGSDACPDSGGSLYFRGGGAEYRVVVRPESGLTVRTRVGADQ